MIVTFCGHSSYVSTKEDEQRVLALLEEVIGDRPADLYLGEYGSFDYFARECGLLYQKTHPNTKLVFVTPYVTEDYLKNHLGEKRKLYDEIVYPGLEDKPLRFAISHRNKWMAEQADYVIACVACRLGGAYRTYEHARRKKKPIFNLTGKEL